MASALTIAFQLAGKATRDALYLSTHDVATLPRMVIGAALLSALLTIALSRLMIRLGPGRVVPALFVASALLLLVEWSFADGERPVVAVLFYLHFSALGALLVSGFWAIIAERFDPRAARGSIGRITTGASIGGLCGGILPGWIGAALPLTAMLPLLALLHLLAAALVLVLRTSAPAAPDIVPGPSGLFPIVRAFSASAYLRGLALLVALTAMAEGLLDWTFKARVTAASPSGEELLRLFAGFYTVTALLGILLQTAVLRTTLHRLGLARSAALLPAGVSLGALGGLLVPGMGSVMLARGTEIVLRSAVFRGAYELLFAPVPTGEKRATKLMVDVGAARLGDMAGGALIQFVLLVAAAWAGGLLLAATIVVALASLFVARFLHRGYTAALARSLTLRAEQLPTASEDGSATLLQTAGGFDLSQLRLRPPAASVAVPAEDRPSAPISMRLTALESGAAEEVKAALKDGPLTPSLVETTIRLLAWDQVAPAAATALVLVVRQELATLISHLLDPDEEFAIRRRLVRVLAECPTAESIEALLTALGDRRFEVRYRAGRALHLLSVRHPELRVSREGVRSALLTEVAVGRGVWESRQLIDAADESEAPLEADLVRDRASRSLEHVFTLLGMLLPREPLRLAYQGLHTDDRHLRGTALEYLESVLPPDVREKLWPFLEPGEVHLRRAPGNPEERVERLLQSRESILLALGAVRRPSGPVQS